MASENWTVEDIVRELRGIKGGQHTNGGLSFERWRAKCQFADDYADRIESAHQREVALLRECLKNACDTECAHRNCLSFRDGKCHGTYDCGRVKRWRKSLEGANALVSEGGEK